MIAEAHATRVEHLLLLFVFTAILDTHLHLTIAYVLLGDRAAFQLLLLFYLFLLQSPIILFLLVLHEALEHGALLQLGGCSSLHRRNSRKGRIAILSVARATRERGLLAARGAACRRLQGGGLEPLRGLAGAGGPSGGEAAGREGTPSAGTGAESFRCPGST